VAEARVEDMLPPVDEPPPFSTAQLVKSVPAPAKPKPPPPPVKREPLQQAAALRVESERRAQEDYLLGVIQKLSRYRFTPQAREASEAGMVVTRVTVARDGRVLDVVLAKSSGFPNLDRGVIDTIRQASPFAPLSPEVADSQLSFIVPISYPRQRWSAPCQPRGGGRPPVTWRTAVISDTRNCAAAFDGVAILQRLAPPAHFAQLSAAV
jgi:TonB family protein